MPDWLDFREAVAELLAYGRREARGAVAPFTRGGLLDRGTPNAVGAVPVAGGGTGHTAGAEPPLGDPPAIGYLLSSAPDGTRRWVPLLAGSGITIAVNEATGAITIGNATTLATLTFGGDDLIFGGAFVGFGEA